MESVKSFSAAHTTLSDNSSTHYLPAEYVAARDEKRRLCTGLEADRALGRSDLFVFVMRMHTTHT